MATYMAPLATANLNLGIVDLLVLLGAVAASIIVGVRLAGRQDSLETFLVGGRNLPWWAILGSIVATETSTATVLSLPGHGYGDTGMKFLQLACGFLIGRFLVVHLLLPGFFRGKLFSAYEVLQQRFGVAATRAASGLFLVTRNVGDGLRLFLAAIVLQKMAGWSLPISALAIGLTTIVYTYLGGMRSVVWNDCIQLVIYMLGGAVSVFLIARAIPGGWDEVWRFAHAEGKLHIFSIRPPDGTQSWWRWLLSDPYTLWAGLLGGAALSLGTHGTDQMMVQRYLSARRQPDAGRAIVLSGVVVFMQFAMFLFIGVQLACYYSHHPEIQFARGDEVYAHFIVHSFPANTGLIGLMLAAILAAAMSTLSSSLNASASAVVNDFYLPRCSRRPDEKALLRLSRFLCAGFGMLQVGIGIWATTFHESVIGNALTIAGFSAGILLGVFLLGTLTTRVNQTAALLGAATGLTILMGLQFGLPPLGIVVAWPWYPLIGATVTFLAGQLFSALRFLYSSQH
ncbi:MAG: transporter [Pirellulaceae bacterium]|nr:MAG: transporter [Pirellulaceae bacterium]